MGFSLTELTLFPSKLKMNTTVIVTVNYFQKKCASPMEMAGCKLHQIVFQPKQGQFPAKKCVKDDVYYTPLQVTKASEKRKISRLHPPGNFS